MKYLKLFDNHSQYTAYKNNQSLFLIPNISYCELEDEVHFTSLDSGKLIAKFNVTSVSSPTQIFDTYSESLFSSVEIDGVNQQTIQPTYTFSSTGEHIVKYTLSDPTNIYYALNECTDLIYVKVPSTVSNTAFAFYGCSNLKKIRLKDGITSLNAACFSQCINLEKLRLPEGLTTIGDGCFTECTNLYSISIPTSVTFIGPNCFDSCSNLYFINLPDGITVISESAFQGCSSLSSITLPSSLSVIGKRAFYGCQSLTEQIIIPSSITKIQEEAFRDCNPQSIKILSTTPPEINDGKQPSQSSPIYVFGPPNDESTNYPIYVPSASVQTYKSAAIWSLYANRIYGF